MSLHPRGDNKQAGWTVRAGLGKNIWTGTGGAYERRRNGNYNGNLDLELELRDGEMCTYLSVSTMPRRAESDVFFFFGFLLLSFSVNS
jgi:hypothetical protein